MRRNNSNHSLTPWTGTPSLWPSTDLFGDFFNDSFWGGMSTGGMKADVRETDTDYLIDIEVPGMKKEDVEISLNDDILTVSAKYDESNEEKKEGHYIRRERRSGVMRRSFSVDNVKADEIDAKLDNGVLTITCPKKEQKVISDRKIEIR